jgi:hypothetical protein
MLQKANEGAFVATQALAKQLGIGIFFDTMDELAAQLRDCKQLRAARERVWQQRHLFTFDHHVPKLVDFFRLVIASTSRKQTRSAGSAAESPHLQSCRLA